MEIMNPEIFDRLENLHQELKHDYFKWALGKPKNGVGSVNNPLTLQFLKEGASKNKLNEIKRNIKLLSNTKCDYKDKYMFLRELYLIHPSFHEMWYFSSHYNHQEIVKGRLGLKAYFTCQLDNESTKKGVTTFLLKRAILIENLYSHQLDRTLIEFSPVKNLKNEIESFLNQYQGNLDHFKVLELIPTFFKIVNALLINYDYKSFNSVLNYDSWMFYAPCSINEGPIFEKISDKSRIEIFKQLSFEKESMRSHLKNNFNINEVTSDEFLE